jgi:cytochrome c1
MQKTGIFPRALALAAAALALGLTPSVAVEESHAPPAQSWSFEGPFGDFDEAQLQRGFKVYREVCANCHSLSLVAFRNLGDAGGPGFTEPQVKALAAEYKIGEVDDNGDPIERPGRPSDYLPKPYQNEQQARAVNGGALPPDLSVMAKAREHGADYLHALLIGYGEAPQGVEVPAGRYYNAYFPGGFISMPPPLTDGQVEYTDGTPATVDQYAKDVAAFLMWTAEPKLEDRKRTGFQSMVFLVVFVGLLYYAKRKIWEEVEH